MYTYEYMLICVCTLSPVGLLLKALWTHVSTHTHTHTHTSAHTHTPIACSALPLTVMTRTNNHHVIITVT